MGGPPASSEPSPRPRRPGEATLRLTLASRATLRPAKSPTTRAVCLGPRAPDPLRAVPADTSCALCTQHRAGPAPRGCACVWQVCPPCGHVALQCQTPSERAAGPSKGAELTGPLGE